jgi:phosphoserine aminotransferase
MEALLNREGVAFDFLNHAQAFPGIRLWCGPTLEAENLKRLLPWLSWAWNQIASAQHQHSGLCDEELK